MIIIPDIHGRTFWKDAVSKKGETEKVIFLGDYLEPYTDREGITHEAAYNNFLEIIEYKKQHMDDCILLLGNHDFACIDRSMISCRHDYFNEERNRNLFHDNMNLFDIAHYILIGDTKYVFSHSGIHKEWYEGIYKTDDEKNTEMCTLLNTMFHRNYVDLIPYLCMYSRYRGFSLYKFGSCVWADCREWASLSDDDMFDNVYQIFGHTQLMEEPVITERWANLDCRKAFRLDEENGKLIQI